MLTALHVSGVKAARTLTPVGTHTGSCGQDGFVLGSDIQHLKDHTPLICLHFQNREIPTNNPTVREQLPVSEEGVVTKETYSFCQKLI